MALGVYPEVTLAQARERHQDGRKQLAAEVDPMAQRKQQASAPAATTFEQATRQWWAHWSSRSARHAEYVIRRLEADIFPEIGNMPIGGIPASAFRDAVKKIEARGALRRSEAGLADLRPNHAVRRRARLGRAQSCCDVRPADVLKVRKKRNYARIDAKELPELLRKIEEYDGSECTVLGLKLMVYTFVRTTELIYARWEEFDIPGALACTSGAHQGDFIRSWPPIPR